MKEENSEAWLCMKLMSLWKKAGYNYDQLLIAVHPIRDIPASGVRENVRDIFNDLSPFKAQK